MDGINGKKGQLALKGSDIPKRDTSKKLLAVLRKLFKLN